MRTIKNLKRTAKVSFISMLTLSLLMSCNETKTESTENDTSSVEQTTVKAPKVDIHTATFFANHEAVKQHIAFGTDLNQKDQYGSTPLNIAATFGRPEIAKSLIDAGANMTLKNAEGSTPLHVAAFFCRTDIVKAMIDKGVDKSILNAYGSTARESVTAPFNEVKSIYDAMTTNLGPLGLKLDYKQLEETRPIIAEMLK